MADKILSISKLSVRFDNNTSISTGIDNISFDVYKGEKLGVVGESGSGKTLTSLSILNLLREDHVVLTQGEITYYGNREENLLLSSEKDLLKIRGLQIGMISQEPMSALNPVLKCGEQVQEALQIHCLQNSEDQRAVVIKAFERVQLKEPERVYHSYPFELSGGQLQRVSIAMAIITNPDIIICDEPTTALDVTIQKEIIALLASLSDEDNITMIFISHDLDIVSKLCDRVIVMRDGQVVEIGKLPDIFINPKEKYTKALLASKPKPEYDGIILPTISEMLEGSFKKKNRPVSNHSTQPDVLLTVEEIEISYQKGPFSKAHNESFKAVDQVSFELKAGTILGIVGESGSGKSSIANAIAGLVQYQKGHILLNKKSVTRDTLSKDYLLRRDIQMIQQDPYSSLNPKMTIFNTIKEVLIQHNICESREIEKRVISLLNKVGLTAQYNTRLPHQLSGGQRQRVCIARSIAINPKLLICDECVSALDMSVQAQILNLLDNLRANDDLSILFISHDLNVVRYLSDELIVLKSGKLIEYGPTDEILNDPKEVYTRQLVENITKSI